MAFFGPAWPGATLLVLLAASASGQGMGGGGRGGDGKGPDWGHRGGGGNKKRHGPSQESIDACVNLAGDAACTVVSPRGHSVDGTCVPMRGEDSSKVHCRPNRGSKKGGRGGGGPGDPPSIPQAALDACKGINSGSKCAVTEPRLNIEVPGTCVMPIGETSPHCRRDWLPDKATLNKRNSSIAGCMGKEAEDECMFRPPVSPDQEARGFGEGRGGKMLGKGKGKGWKERMSDWKQRRAPPRGARPERPGICVPMKKAAGAVNFCRALPPAESVPVCEDLNVNDTCAFETNGTETFVNLKVFTGAQPMAETQGSVLASFFINGGWTDPELFFTGAEQGEEKSKVFALDGVPRRVSLSIWSNDAWCFWKIIVNDTVILEDAGGAAGSDPYFKENESSTFADSRFWIEGPPSSQIFDVHDLVMSARRLSQQFSLRIFTTNTEAAATTGSVFIGFLVQGNWTEPELMFTGAAAGEEKSKNFALDAYPEKVWISTNSSDAYSYWKIMVNEQAVIQDPSGSAGSQEYDALGSLQDESEFWIQSPPSAQTFSIAEGVFEQSGSKRKRHIKGTCEETWWDMMNGTLFCRPAGKRFKPQRPRGSRGRTMGDDRDQDDLLITANQMEPDFDFKSSAPEHFDSKVILTMVVNNLNYDQLLGNEQVKTDLVKNIQVQVAIEAGQGVYPEHVKVTFAPGSVVVTAKIDPPPYISRSYLRSRLQAAPSFAQTMQKAIAGISDINTVSTGTISVGAQTVAKPVQASEPAPDDDSNTMVLAVIAAASIVVAICMCMVSCIMWKKLRAKPLNPEIDGTTIAVGRPVQSGEDNDVSAGLPVNPVSAPYEGKPGKSV